MLSALWRVIVIGVVALGLVTMIGLSYSRNRARERRAAERDQKGVK